MIYVILTEEQFNSSLPDELKFYMGYPENHIVRDCLYGTPRQLSDGRWLCDARFRTYYKQSANGLDIIGISNNCTEREILYQFEIDMWVYNIGDENVITDITNLTFMS